MWMLWLIGIVGVPLMVWGLFLHLRDKQIENENEREKQAKGAAIA